MCDVESKLNKQTEEQGTYPNKCVVVKDDIEAAMALLMAGVGVGVVVTNKKVKFSKMAESLPELLPFWIM